MTAVSAFGSSTHMTADGESSQDESGQQIPIDESLILELNFVPQWARKEPGAITYPSRGRHDFDGPRDRGRRERGGRSERRRPREPRRDRDAFDRGPRRPQTTEHGAERPREHVRRERPELPPVRVRLVPAQKGLGAIVRRIRSTRRAYPLDQLAHFMLSSPDSCYFKVEPLRGNGSVSVFQCKICRTVALDRDELISHVAGAHTDMFFEREDVTIDPPSGAFACVAKCGLSGVLLGPPNYHGFAETVQRVRRERFPAMPLEDYRRRIETVRDEESIEKWKEQYRHQTIYRLKSPESEAVEPVDAAAAEEYLRANIAPSQVVRSKSASVPLDVGRAIADAGLNQAVAAVWNRENRFPRFLMLALKAAVTHMRLYVFKAGHSLEFVTAVKPSALDPEHTIESIRETLVFLRDHAGCKRGQLVHGLRPDVKPDDHEVEEILSPLSWLIEKGHIIEFFDGSLSVPLGRSGKGG